MYETLVAALRNVSEYDSGYAKLMYDAADAIEVLSKTEKTTKPHGRLIDADALKEQLEYVASLKWNQRVGASPGIECAIDMLDDAQTVIPAEPPKEEENDRKIFG
jgi:hypothetical protein